MAQKVIKIGSSAGITLSKTTLEELGLEIGDTITVEANKKNMTVTIMPLVKVDKELVNWTKNFIEKYRPALEALAKK